MTELQPFDNSELSNGKLNRKVAEWLDEVECCSWCAGSGLESQMPRKVCSKCGGAGRTWPQYTEDDGAAWRLLGRMTGRTKFWGPLCERGAIEADASIGDVGVSNYDPVFLDLRVSALAANKRRALAEAAAELADRGVEPREV